MDSEHSDQIRELSSRLIKVLRVLAEFPGVELYGEKLPFLVDRLETVHDLANDPDSFRQVWPETQYELFRFLDILSRAGIKLSELGWLIGILGGRTIDFIAPPSFRGLDEAIAQVASDLDRAIQTAAAEEPGAALSESVSEYSLEIDDAAPDGSTDDLYEADDEDSGGYSQQYPAEAADDRSVSPADVQPEPAPEPAPRPARSKPVSTPGPELEPQPAEAESFADRGLDALPAPSAPSAGTVPEETAPSQRVVNTGFSDRGQPESEIHADQPLQQNAPYWFWVEIGPVQRGSIEDVPTALPSSLPANAVLTVAVFSFPGELMIGGDADVGTVRLTGSVASEVIDQPGSFEHLFANSSIRKRRLFFPVTTPPTPGRYRMRCNIYYEHVLLQSRIIAAHVEQTPRNEPALRSTVDFKLSHTLDPARLSRMAPQTLSVFVNDNPGDAHGFYFEGQQELKTQSLPDTQQLQDSLTQTRKTLRRIAWGSPDPWQPSFAYRYSSSGEPAFFTSDLIALAIRGYMVYSALIDKMSGGAEASSKLETMMLKPGRVQISSRESARMVVPAAMFYDYPLDTQSPTGHRVCDAFLKAVRAHEDLEESPCFRGECPHLSDMDVVCPGGFWGYRHEVGLPVSIEQAGTGDADTDIQFNDPASMVAIVSMDPMFKNRETHESQLKLIRTPLGFTLCESRSTALTALQQQQAQMVYFYCHGGLTPDNTPFLSIGNNEALTPDNIRAYRIRWEAPRPLVFMNGCMTTALEPEKAIDFVTAFVNQAAASGVIGTEITVFEPLATEFAQAFLTSFLGQCKSIGESVKLARLALLKQFNPLGLVYIPFALPGLRLVDLATPKAAAGSNAVS